MSYKEWIEASAKADDEAHASSLAWLSGPEEFVRLIKHKGDLIKERIEKEYAASEHYREPETEGDSAGGGSPGSGP